MNNVIWRNFRLRIPDDWEILLYSKNPKEGRCAFADRYQYRLELHWREVPGAPDFERMLADYSSRLKKDDKAEDVQAVHFEKWQGIAATVKEMSTSRFGRYFAEEGCLVELVFLWATGRERTLERNILVTLTMEPIRDGCRRWQAFGMQMRVTAELPLAECVVQPGLARLLFHRAKAPQREERFERLGLVSQWLKAPVDEWLRKRTPGEVRVTAESCSVVDGHTEYRLDGSRLAIGLPRLLGRRVPYRATAWICPVDDRLYYQVISGATLEAVGLACGDRQEGLA